MQLTYRTVMTRALGVGVVVGVSSAIYLAAFTERTIDDALALEEALAAEADDHAAHDHEEPLFTRHEQIGGGVVAALAYSVVAAAIFGTVYAATRHRIPAGTEMLRSVWLAAIAFGAVALVPALKYPANPPAVGDPDTVGERTLQYLSCVTLSIVLAILLVRLSALLRPRLDDATRIVVVAAATVVAYGLLLVLLPGTPDAVDPAVPAELIWEFRLRSLGGLALLWAGLGLGLGWTLERAMAGAARAAKPCPSTSSKIRPPGRPLPGRSS